MDIFNQKDMPIGLGMAFAQNLEAMQRFSDLSDEAQKEVIMQARNVKSRDELDIIVNDIGKIT